MSTSRIHVVAPLGLVVGAVLGMAGTFSPTAALRGLVRGLDGTALVLATALLTMHHFRRGNDLVAAGFLVFVVGQTLVLSGAAMDLVASGPSFAPAWACGLLHSSSSVHPVSCLDGSGAPVSSLPSCSRWSLCRFSRDVS